MTLGYCVVDGYEGRGYGTEMVAGLLYWASESARVRQVFATTFERHVASIAVLRKNGFECHGVSSEDAAACEDNRQGRGQLILWIRQLQR